MGRKVKNKSYFMTFFTKKVVSLYCKINDGSTNNCKGREMEEKVLKVEEIPWGYPLCFNKECADKDKCMHYQAWLLMPRDRYSGAAVFPTAWEDGKCRCFREKKLVKKAWGFTRLYENVPQRDKAEARRCVHALFGGGNGPYYRAHHGVNKLSPKQQEEILAVLVRFGSVEGIGFDHYDTDWDFE